jgi:hypothetical protein
LPKSRTAMQALGRLDVGGETSYPDDGVCDRCEVVLSISEPWKDKAMRSKANRIDTFWRGLGP